MTLRSRGRILERVILFLEPFGGMAGDMLLAALLDLGDERFTLADLERFAELLVPGECRLRTSEVRRAGFRGRTLEVVTDESADPPERHLAELQELLLRAPLSSGARARAERILVRLAEAESRVHGIPVDEVHFHEVGAIDTLIDVGGAAFALERLGVERVLASAPYAGGGTVRCAHGELPVPTPGTAALLAGMPVRYGPGGERVTPTGAALLAELVERFEPEETLVPLATGTGAGSRDPESGPPNLLRVTRCEVPAAARANPVATVWQIECNLDDATGEEVGHLLAELRAAGALEAWSAPIQMKKDRPGTLVAALGRPERAEALERVFFAHSPTLGVRFRSLSRRECAREEVRVELAGRSVRVKLRRRPGLELTRLDVSPEYEDLAELARSSGRSLRELEAEAIRAVLDGDPGEGPSRRFEERPRGRAKRPR